MDSNLDITTSIESHTFIHQNVLAGWLEGNFINYEVQFGKLLEVTWQNCCPEMCYDEQWMII